MKTHKSAKKNKTVDMATDVAVHVVGKNLIQNELIVSFIEDNMGASCTQHHEIDMSLKTQIGSSGAHLVLMDCQSRQDCNPWAEYDSEGFLDTNQCRLTFYNVHPDAGIEQTAIGKGVRGIFYNYESFKVFPKGLHAILCGELWLSRRILARLLLGVETDMQIPRKDIDRLTYREKEILLKIATGATNQEIADDFLISIHTVKTHIYNIYKKNRMSNRLQTSLWAATIFDGQ